jgi:signal transduction histidine kinase/CheY-like chemotaxis protein
VRVEVTNYRKDRRPFLVELDIRPIPDRTGWITHWVSVQRDVTMRRAAEAQELQSDRIQTISLLAGGIAHDFNNLLVGVAGNLELARASLHAPDEVRELLFEAEQASQQARNLTRQLMDMSKDAEPHRTHFALSAVLRQAACFACRGSSVQTKVEFPTGNPNLRVHADWGQLTQLFTNLALNAVEAMEGSGQLTLRVRVADSGSIPVELDSSREWVVAELEDSGPGLPGSDVKELFRPYFSTKARGSGIGLTICWMIAHRHGGHVDMQSTPDGAKVRVFLPRSNEHVHGCPKTAGSVESTTDLPTRDGARPLSGLRVLWMDDDEMVRNVATRIARRLGWRLTLASRGEEVLSHLGSNPEAVADVVLLDLTVKGGLGGRETLDAIRKISRELPVLLASGYVTAEGAGGAEGMARVRRIAKPFRIRELREAIEALTGTEREAPAPTSPVGSPGGG